LQDFQDANQRAGRPNEAQDILHDPEFGFKAMTSTSIDDRSGASDLGESLAARIERSRRHINGLNSAEGAAELRSIQSTLKSRRDKVYYSLRAAAVDPEVVAFQNAASEDFSAGRFDRAETNYWQCCRIYPWHPEFALGYAGALYQQNRLVDCETMFRHALALGADEQRVGRLLQDVAKRAKAPYVSAPKCRFDPDFSEPINAIASVRGDSWIYPDLATLRTLVETMTGQSVASLQYLGKLLRNCRTSWDALAFIIGSAEFRSANLDLCYVIGSMPRIGREDILR